jgi:NarL family two-component system response regulator LiaR
MKTLRILIADDHLVVREGLGTIITAQPDMQVVGKAANGEEAVALAQALTPDVILMDLRMPRLDGVDAIRQIREADTEASILVLTSYANDRHVFAAIKAGAMGYLLKDATHDQLIQAIRDVAQGTLALHPDIALQVIRELERPTEVSDPVVSLTDREVETLQWIARGLNNQEIGATLGIHERTVAKYVSSILSKLHLSNRTQAALYALREGIADLE